MAEQLMESKQTGQQAATGCCGPAEQASCCETAAKAACCDDAAGPDCGCH